MEPSHVRADTVGSGDFRAVGDHLLSLARDAGGLQPHHRILDVGCGIGRLAVPLTEFITTGEYAGFDVSKSAVNWCRKHITPRFPNFTFTRVDVFNSHYNPRGKVLPSAFVFPCEDASVDMVFLSSILTHLTPDALMQYIAETARVLKAGGRAVMTFFLLDDYVREQQRHGLTDATFTTYPEPWWAVQDASDFEAAVAYERDTILRILRTHHLSVASSSRGRWTGDASGLTYQDLIVAEKSKLL